MTVAQDITTSHREQLDRLNREVTALRHQLREAQRMASVGTMTAMIAHEFNNILTPIINYAQMAKRNPSLTDKALARAADGGQRASAICKAILDMTRKSSEQPEPVNVSELLSDTLQAMARAPMKERIELFVEAPADIFVRVRRVELQQVLLNLLVNARQAVLAVTHQRRIEVLVRTVDGRIAISISDTGVGIPPENMSKIFEPFFTTRKDGDGSDGGYGLGLPLCKEIVESMGGDIHVQSPPGRGSTFTVQLPY